MRLALTTVLMVAPALAACGSAEPDGADACTIQAVGKETGASNLRATLSVPEAYVSGAEITNGGVTVDVPECDFPLNAFLSDETAVHIIDTAPRNTLTSNGFRLVEADLSIWKFTDGSGEPRFFVTGVHSMSPIPAPRNALERQRYETPREGS